jgi:hypothetical protein|tara:strand:+ start:3344 stop:3991 length:648 start_codon:yes stop_codon:yes gene_type:complete
MGMESKIVVRTLDSIYRGIDTISVADAMTRLSTAQGKKDVWKALDISYELDENGNPDSSKVTNFQPTSMNEWVKLPVRDYDLSIKTVRGPIRVPGVIVSQTFSDTVFREPKFSKENVLKRDGYTCQFVSCPYCGNKQLDRSELNIDHLIPSSRGGSNTWTNTVASCIKMNSVKDNKTLKEARLVIIRKPFKPSPEIMSTLSNKNVNHIDWKLFIK